jgi:2-haloacid dehalogenase
MITTIIFDLGGVLIDWNPEYLYRKVFKDESEMKHFLEKVCTPEWNEEQDAGRTLAEAIDFLLKNIRNMKKTYGFITIVGRKC